MKTAQGVGVPVKPDYAGGSIVNLMASIRAGLGGGVDLYDPAPLLCPSRVAAASAVVLLVVDGLGYDYLRAQAVAPHLNAHLAGALTSVFPSTTATAVTTFMTGDAPQQHGVTGWHMYMRELGAVITVLPGQPRFGGASLAAAGYDLPAVLGHRPFTERIAVPSAVVTPSYLVDSAYTQAHLGPASVHGYGHVEDLFQCVSQVLNSGAARYVHAYWPDLDGSGHMHGMGSENSAQVLARFDAAFALFLEALKGSDTLVLVSADHGQVDTTPGDWHHFEDHPALVDALAMPLCGEPRAAFCYVRGRGGADAFEPAITSAFGSTVAVHGGAEWIEHGWYGLGEPHPELGSRTGDYLLVPSARHAVKDWMGQERRYSVIGVHGGTTRDEMLVPLAAVTV